MNLSFTYPAWYILLCVVCGAAGAFLLYYKDRRFSDLGKSFTPVIWLMAVIRCLAISFIAFFLLSPLIRTTTNRTEKPIVVFAQDNSESVLFKKSKEDSAAYAKVITDFTDLLSKDYDVKTYSFGSSLREGLNFSFRDKSTNISDALTGIENLYTNQNLGAIVLASDGIYNEGSNPVYVKSSVNVPVYTIALGDTAIQRDLVFTNVLFNRLVFLGDYFPLKAEYTAQFCNNEKTKITVSEVSNGKEKQIAAEDILIQGNDFNGTAEFTIKAEEPGMLHYRLRLSPLDKEASTANNVRDIFVEVVEKKEKILILANAPHPDIAAIKQSIEQNKNYQADVVFGGTLPPDFDSYSLVVLHQLPSVKSSVPSLVQDIHAKKKSILFILGAQTNLGLFNTMQSMVDVNGSNGSTTDAFAVWSKDFSFFNVPQEAVDKVASFPPLSSPFGEYKVAPSASVMLYQKIGSVTTKYPLVLFQQDLDGRTGVIAGEGLWRWRMYDYQQSNNHEAFDGLMSSIVQYLSVKQDERQFRVRLQKEQMGGGGKMFAENESVIFNAELLNESNELINTPDVSITITDEQGKEYPFVFSKTANLYTLNAGFFPVGNYTYLAKTNYNKKDLTAAGTFSVTPTQLEFEATHANHQLLYTLSEQSGGQLFYPSQVNDLQKAIREKQDIKPVLYSTTRTEPLINLRWLIIPILLLLTVEWGIRKFNGAY